MRPQVVALGCSLALLTGSAASGAQMDPTVAPTTEGPITLSNESYSGSHCARVAYRGAAVSKSCRFFYRFDPEAETDADNDHGVWWFQVTFRPRPGWCLLAARTKVTMPAGFVASAWTAKDRRVRLKKAFATARLRTTAGDNSAETALVERSFILRKGRYVNKWAEDGSGMKLRWSGNPTRRAVAFAGGFDGSWPATDTPPPYGLVGGPTYTRC